MKVDVIIPARDEAESLPGVLASLPAPNTSLVWFPRAEAPGHSPAPRTITIRSIVVVDNGSSDDTASVARPYGAVVVSEPRGGYGAACLAGLASLRATPPDAVAFMDGDGSDDPGDLPSLLAPLASNEADLVIGSRVLGEREPGSLTPVQLFGNSLATRLLALFYGVRFTDLGPFRAIRWAAFERLGMRDRDYGWTVEMQARALAGALRCAEIPVRYRRRRAGRSKVAGNLRGSALAGWKILTTIGRVRCGG